jgi:hypothetical protein
MLFHLFAEALPSILFLFYNCVIVVLAIHFSLWFY